MKRLLLAVALVSALATAAEATTGRVAVVVPKGPVVPSGETQVSGTPNQISRNKRIVLDVMDGLGWDYFLLRGDQVKVEQLRRGVIQHGANVDTVLGVVHLSFYGSASSNAQSGYRGDSLMRFVTNSTVAGVDVPHLFLSDNLPPLTSGVLSTSWMDDAGASAATRCSTGVTGNQTNPTYGQGAFFGSDHSLRFQPHTYVAGWTLNGTAPEGGIRVILGLSANGNTIKWQRTATANINAMWPDSMPFVEASDTVAVWERLWQADHLPSAKPQVFCQWAGVGAPSDSMANESVAGFPIAEGDISTLLVGLARFDSLCGGLSRKSISGAITVQGALSRGLRRWNVGIAPGDTASFYGSLDSLAAWGVPVTFFGNVNADSATAYARDVIKLKSVWNARFAPQVWDGVVDTTVGGVLAVNGRYGNPRDIFGKNTVRAAYGDGSGVGADSSVWAQLRVAKALNDSIYGSNRASRSLRAPLDDWDVPGATMAKVDSTLWAMGQAGYGTLIVDGRKSLRGRPGGTFKRQHTYRPMAGAEHPIRILAHRGGPLSGGNWQQVVWDSSTANAHQDLIIKESDRAFAALALRHSHRNFDSWIYDNVGGGNWRNYLNVRNENEDFFVTTFPEHGSIVNLSCASLSGDPSSPARTGLWVIKALWSVQRITSQLAWHKRPLLRLTYPESVNP